MARRARRKTHVEVQDDFEELSAKRQPTGGGGFGCISVVALALVFFGLFMWALHSFNIINPLLAKLIPAPKRLKEADIKIRELEDELADERKPTVIDPALRKYGETWTAPADHPTLAGNVLVLKQQLEIAKTMCKDVGLTLPQQQFEAKLQDLYLFQLSRLKLSAEEQRRLAVVDRREYRRYEQACNAALDEWLEECRVRTIENDPLYRALDKRISTLWLAYQTVDTEIAHQLIEVRRKGTADPVEARQFAVQAEEAQRAHAEALARFEENLAVANRLRGALETPSVEAWLKYVQARHPRPSPAADLPPDQSIVRWNELVESGVPTEAQIYAEHAVFFDLAHAQEATGCTTARRLSKLARLYAELGDYTIAHGARSQADALLTATIAKDPMAPEKANTTVALAIDKAAILYAERRIVAALAASYAAVEAAEQQGPFDPALKLELWRQHAKLLAENAEYQEAAKFANEGAALALEAGKHRPAHLKALLVQAEVEIGLGRVKQALEALEGLHSQFVETFSDDHPVYAEFLRQLARAEGLLALETAAQTHLQSAIDIYAKVYGPEHLEVAWAAIELADIEQWLQDHLAAQQILEGLGPTFDALEKQVGNRNRSLPRLRAYLAISRAQIGLGLYEAAERSLYPCREAANQEVSELTTLDRAGVDEVRGLFACSRSNVSAGLEYVETAFETRQRVQGPEHLETLRVQQVYGRVLAVAEERGAARKQYEAALDTLVKVMGEGHPLEAELLHVLADSVLAFDDPELAGPTYQKAIAILEKVHGQDHVRLSPVLTSLARHQVARGQKSEALGTFDRARKIVRQYVNRVLPSLSSEEQLQFLERRDRPQLETAISLALQPRPDQETLERTATWVLNGKGVAFESLAATSMRGRDSNNPEVLRSRLKLIETRRKLSTAMLLPLHSQPRDWLQIRQMQRDEKTQAKRLRTLVPADDQAAEWVELDDIRKHLPPDVVLVEFIRTPMVSFRAAPYGTVHKSSDRYVAFIIPRINHGVIRVVDLGRADQIDGLIHNWRTAIFPPDESPKAQKKVLVAGELLRQKLFTPIVDATGGYRRMIISPDSSLWMIPFAAIPYDLSKFVLEEFEIRYVMSGRHLNRPRPTPDSGKALIVAGPDYGRIPRRPSVFQPLPGAQKDIERSWPGLEQYTGQRPEVWWRLDAQEMAFKRCGSPRVILVSTHGFYFTNSKVLKIDNPLIRCGLAFAGANLRHVNTADDDGILTGLEIVDLDLRKTELIMLSACQTGLGEINDAEGLTGLRHAFHLAGAQSVAATLWSINDLESVWLAGAFFNALGDGKTSHEALRAAQLFVIRELRQRSTMPSPFYWAGFTITSNHR